MRRATRGRLTSTALSSIRRGAPCERAEHAVEVTRQEFHLLYVLASNPGIVFTRERLLSKVWQEQAFVTGRSVDTLVKRLRKKIEVDPAAPQLILTVWGDGYKFADV